MGYQKVKKKVISDTDGLELDVLELIPEGEPKGIFQIHHGMSEYKERYFPFMEYLAQAGYVAVIHDCRGHGKSVRSQEDHGYMYGGGMNALIEDTHQIMMMEKEIWKECPVILFGHSMGSLVVRAYAAKYDDEIDMLVVCGSPSKNPYLFMGKRIAKIQEKIKGSHSKGKILELLTLGPYAKAFASEKNRYAWICTDKAVLDHYERSPMCGFTFTVDGYQTLFELMGAVYAKTDEKCRNPELPVLFVGGADDPCIGGARRYAQAVQHMRHLGYLNTKGKLYPGMRHEILNEKGKEKVFGDILKYMEKQLGILSK
ncbi:MAG: alpha/beta hydrolase [Clostridia bacterium]|nr:alpha/beta hydrolase [Clostridia bacterium]NCC44728.1 alpha/beta hydrolase [Clostridia bacterium]